MTTRAIFGRAHLALLAVLAAGFLFIPALGAVLHRIL